MKRKQWAALVLSAILSFSACIPATGTGVYAAENDVTQETVFEEAAESAFEETAEAPAFAGEDAGGDALTGDSAADPFAAENTEAEIPQAFEDAGAIEAPEEAAVNAAEPAGEEAAASEAGTAFEEADPFAAEAGTEDTGFSAPADADGNEGTEFYTAADPAAPESTEFDAAADPAGAGGTEFEIPSEEAGDAFEEISAPADTAASESTEFDAAAAPASDPFAETPSDPADAAAGEEQTFLTEDGQEEAVSEKGQNSSIEPTEENFASAADIAAGDVLDVNITREAPAFFRFIPAETGGYKIYSTNETNCDPGLILYDESGSNIGSADDENGSDFSYEAVFNEGSVYYLQAYCYGSEAVYQIHLEKPAFFVEHGETARLISPGEEVTLEVNAVSSSPLSYQWYLNDAPVEGETSSAFTFTPERHCNVSCSVSDEDGNSENVNYEIFFETGLTASAAGDSTFSLDPGSSQTLAVEASANEGIELSYRWFNRTTEEYIESDSGDPARCTIENLQSYTEIICYVSDPYGNEILVWFYLKVNGNLPVWPNGANIGEDSFTCSVNRGDDYQLYVNSNSDAELSYAWYDENDTLLQEGSINYYNLENIQDDCTIRCHVSETENPDMAKDLYFHVKLAVEITLRPEASIDCESQDDNSIWLNILNHDEVTLRAVVETTGETEGITYRWFKEDYDEDEGYKWSVIPDAASDSLTISLPVAGSYYCEATDTDGNNAFAYYHLTGGSGWISAYDSNYGGNSVTLDADTLESPALDLSVTAGCEFDDRLTYQWYRQSEDGYTPIDGAVSSAYTLENPQNGTSYYCLVDSGYGQQETVYYYFRRNNNLSVYADDTKKSNELILDPREADSFTLTPAIEADDTEGLSYLWTYTGSNGKEDPVDSTGASLTVTGQENNVSYNCQVTDRYGNSANAYYRFFADTHLKVYAEGDTRKGNVFYINISGMDSLTLTGAAEVDEGTSLTWSWEKNDTAIDGETGTFMGGGQSSLQVDSPEAGDIYRFRVEDNYGNYDYVDFRLVSETTPLRIYPDGGSEGDDSIDVNLNYDQNPARLSVRVAECIDDLALKYVWKNEAGEVLYEVFEDSTYNVYDPVDGAKYSCTAIDQFGQEATVWFTLHVELDPDGPTKEEFENAQEIRAGETADVTLETYDDYRMFRFTAEKDGVYLFSSSHQDEHQDPQAWLYDQNYRENSYFDDENGNYDFLAVRSCKAGETWYLKAWDRAAGTYTLRLEETGLYAGAYGSTDQTRYIGETCDLEVYAFSTSGLHFQWYEGDADASEDSFREIGGAADSVYSYTVERTSSFRCRVTDDEGHSEDIVFRVTAEIDRRPKNSDFENAKELKAGEPAHFSLTEEKYAEIYRFTAEEAGRYRFTASDDDGYNDPDITIYWKTTFDDDDGGTYDDYYEHSYGRQSNTDDLSEGETIYLRISRYANQPGNVTLQAERLPFWTGYSSESSPNVRYGESVDLAVEAWSATPLHYQWYTTPSFWEDDLTTIDGAVSDTYTHRATKDQRIDCKVWDDAGHSETISFYIYLIRDPSEEDFAEASAITAGEEKAVTLTEEHFARFFKFTPEKTGAYTVETVIPEGGHQDTYTYATIYDENREELESVNGDGNWGRSLYKFMAEAGRTYYIRTRAEDYQPIDYSIRLAALSFYVTADGRYRSTDIFTDPDSAEEIILKPVAWSDSNLHYQWLVHEDYWAEDDGTVIPGANGDTFTVPERKTSAYSCLVSDDNGNKETLTYRITIENDLYLNAEETEITCKYGETATLSVTASARDKEGLRYSWYKYDENDESIEISGANETTITTEPVTKAAEYYCLVTDRFDNKTTLDFSVNVENHFDAYPDPSVGTIQDDDGAMVVEFKANETPKTLRTNVNADDKEEISYSWRYGSDVEEAVGANSPELVPDRTGSYRCTVEDKFGNRDYAFFYVRIKNDVKASADGDTTVEAYAGSPATLKVTATALDPASIVYRWYEFTGTTNWLLLEDVDTASCVIPSVDHDARYFCYVTDSYENDYEDNEIYFTVKKIDPIDLSSAEVTVAANGLTYDGKAKTPAVTVEYGGKALIAGTDYDVTYTGNINAGTDTAKVTVTGKTRYKGTVEKTFSIAKAAQDLKAGNLSIAFSASKKLTITGAQGAVTYESDAPAVAAVTADGTVTGSTIGSAKITVSAAGNANYLPAHAEVTITVTAAKLTAGHVTVDAEGLVYNGKDQTPAVTVKYGSTVLTAGTDYDLTYENNKDAGTDTAKAIVTGRGNYTGTAEKTFSIAKADYKITAKAAKTTLSATQKTTIKVTGAKGKVSYKSNKTTVATVDANGNVTAKAVGTATITVTDAGNANYNKAAAVKVIIKVTPKATTKLTAASQAKGIKLTWAKVAGANGYIIYRNTKKVKTITSGSTVTWTDTGANTNGTKYTFKVVAKAATGTSALSKSLVTYHVSRPAISSAANTAAKKMTVKWKKNAKASGYEIQYTLKSSFSGAKSVKITKAATVSKVIGGLQKGKTYYIRIRTYKTVGKTKYYSAWSASKKLKITK